jgi:hypothetical protein
MVDMDLTVTKMQFDALVAYSKAAGNCWRLLLNHDWQREVIEGVAEPYTDVLRNLKKTHGPKWLANFKVDAGQDNSKLAA